VKKLFLLFVALLCISAGAHATNPVVEKAHKTSHKIKMYSVLGGSAGTCSATAIGPHALLTASHCISTSAIIDVDGREADVMGTIGDGLDHTIILERGVNFADYSDVATTKPQIADEVFVFGNPGPMTDVFRKGYVAGFNHNDDDPETPAEALQRPRQRAGNDAVEIIFYDFNGFFGDSGSAVFNNDGKVVAVTSFIYGGNESGHELKFMGSYELRLTAEQLQQARDYNPPAKPKLPEAPKRPKSFFDLFK
jgi:hypothetical protein